MPYWIRDSGGKLVKIENPHETELEFCLNIMEATPKAKNPSMLSSVKELTVQRIH